VNHSFISIPFFCYKLGSKRVFSFLPRVRFYAPSRNSALQFFLMEFPSNPGDLGRHNKRVLARDLLPAGRLVVEPALVAAVMAVPAAVCATAAAREA
jgi:hypothetical protein